MQVKAKKLGYYNHKRRAEGVVFTLVPVKVKGKDGKLVTIEPEDQFSEKWMEKFDAKGSKKAKAAAAPEEEAPAEGESDESVI